MRRMRLICPECGRRYRRGAYEDHACAACGAALVRERRRDPE